MNNIKIDFSPGSPVRQYINQEFFKPKWEVFRNWFFETYDQNDQKQISKEFYEFSESVNKIIEFIPWFITTYVPAYINVIERE